MNIVLKSVQLEWPNGNSLFQDLNLTLKTNQKYGLVGPNGSGKSTLAKLIQGSLSPTCGWVQKRCQVAYFAQEEVPPSLRVEDYLRELWMNVRHEDVTLAASLLGQISLSAFCSRLSGGEWTRVRLLKQLASGAEFMILDEPTNNLDCQARQSVFEFVQKTSSGILVISHDRELLKYVAAIVELSNQGLSIFGGNWSFYESERHRERERLWTSLERAQDAKQEAQRERTKKLNAQRKRMEHAKKAAPLLGMPRILIGARKRRAQQTLGKLNVTATQELNDKAQEAQQAWLSLKSDATIYAEFPETTIPASKLVFEAREFNFKYSKMSRPLWKENLNFVMKGAMRLCLKGNNGSGKTTFLKLLTGLQQPDGQVLGSLKLGEVGFGLIDQQLLLLSPDKTVFDNVYATSARSRVEIRNLLAQFLFPGKKADQLVSTLSGGERLRVALGKVLISEPAPQLLILDEPTNNLDIGNLEFLEKALATFEGALIVISHDQSFLDKIGINCELTLQE